MRKPKADTAETRKRIVETAAGAFRKQGIAANGVVENMATAGLTHGGFYRHFRSRDQLAAEDSAPRRAWCGTPCRPPTRGRKYAGRLFQDYMTQAYRYNVEDGCPLATMGSEVVRADDNTRRAATVSLRKIIETFVPFTRSQEVTDGTVTAPSLLTNMVGALTIARMIDDPALSNRILDTTRQRIARSINVSRAPSKHRVKRWPEQDCQRFKALPTANDTRGRCGFGKAFISQPASQEASELHDRCSRHRSCSST